MANHEAALAALRVELEYADKKRQETMGGRDSDDHSLAMYPDNFQESHYGFDMLQYVHRATILRLDTRRGQQALLKAVATGIAALEASWRLWGVQIVPGEPS